MSVIQLKHFTIPITAAGTEDDEINKFLRGHQVLNAQEKLVCHQSEQYWCITVRYAAAGSSGKTPRRQSVDYREVLAPEVFARFVDLRKRRKEIAATEEIPAFAVFTDKELAAIAELESPLASDLEQVEGIADKRVKRFGQRILQSDAT